MRALMELVETGALIVLTAELEEKLDDEALVAFRAAAILRPTDVEGREEVSPSDFFRALRALYRIEGRGLPVPGAFDPHFQCIGWTRDEQGDRAVVFVRNPARALNITLHYPQRALVLVPTARAMTRKHREQHGPGRWVHVEALEEALGTEGGRLARGSRVYPTSGAAHGSAARALVQAAAPTAPARLALPRVKGLARWNQLRVCRVHDRMVRLDLAKKHYRRTPTDMGMAYKGTGAPTKQWDMLIELCMGNGYFKSWKFGNEEATRKVIHRLRSDMCAYFGLADSPFERYRRSTGWRTKFVAEPRLPGRNDDEEDDED